MEQPYVVFDCETTLNGPEGNRASPFWPGNKAVYWGYRVKGAVLVRVLKNEHMRKAAGYTYIGQNISFDLHYMAKESDGWFPSSIWDVQLAEYILSGQVTKYASLDELATKYGGTVKDSNIKEYFEKGIGADLIPEAELVPYLEQDVLNTEIVYLAQLKEAERKGMLPLIKSQMAARLATSIMEWNGLKVNWEYVEDTKARLTAYCEDYVIRISRLATKWDERVVGPFNHASVKHLSAYFFGTPIKYKVDEVVGKYKNGKYKTKKVEYEWRNPHPLDPTKFGSELNARGEYTVDDDVLKNIAKVKGEYGTVAGFLKEWRQKNKWLTTYYENMLTHRSVDGCIHPSLNHVSTDTGRLSCTKPNIQNQTTEGGIKDAYVSRFGDEGVLVEIDYSQLEVVGLAYISNDKQLIDDINHGRDIHTELFKDMYGRLPDKDERKAFKPRTFLTIYGGTAGTLAKQTGIPLHEAKTFIKVFYERYKGVAKWHEDMVFSAKRGRKVTKKHSPKLKMPIGAYVHRLPTGRAFVFSEWENEWSSELTFSPTQLKNWPVQGFATGDVVPHMVGVVVGALQKAELLEHIVPICTVHDSILFDIKKEWVHNAIHSITTVLNNTASYMEEHFSLPKMPVKFKVEASVGPTWGSLEAYKGE